MKCDGSCAAHPLHTTCASLPTPPSTIALLQQGQGGSSSATCQAGGPQGCGGAVGAGHQRRPRRSRLVSHREERIAENERDSAWLGGYSHEDSTAQPAGDHGQCAVAGRTARPWLFGFWLSHSVARRLICVPAWPGVMLKLWLASSEKLGVRCALAGTATAAARTCTCARKRRQCGWVPWRGGMCIQVARALSSALCSALISCTRAPVCCCAGQRFGGLSSSARMLLLRCTAVWKPELFSPTAAPPACPSPGLDHLPGPARLPDRAALSGPAVLRHDQARSGCAPGCLAIVSWGS